MGCRRPGLRGGSFGAGLCEIGCAGPSSIDINLLKKRISEK